MAWFNELGECGYFGEEFRLILRAVGWLERGKHFDCDVVDRRVYDALVDMLRNPWQPIMFRGIHRCDLCRYTSEASGSRNLFVPGDRVIFVCPELVVHYMNAHGYAPPAEFCDAVLNCPPMASRDYFQILVASGGRSLMKLASI